MFNLTGAGLERLNGAVVSAGMLPMLGVRMRLGRGFRRRKS
jgi:hypothetical protein